ncbi:hypothetical protein CAPTEDRAFT_193938 [Capitella teleta]|uniref:SUEL-type lectin domain-containing protein n=1 Tax=Capitella teleta TaxID=283909 RepID=R7TS48_CAPTE|nr:hypothetical protein CAPTEDRAFT_193938 [Capitella teleta]|eukprot:ELT93835.1 hypothetical protein CAPTEDRAFT_193938 [Capitella teleta]
MEYNASGLWTLFAFIIYFPTCIPFFIDAKEIIEETCNLETFSPRCSSQLNIFITRSYHGHIKLGKCVKMDFGQFGCKADVTEIVRRRCNGKPRCQVEAIDDAITDTQPCLQGLYTYLETAYVCIPELTQIENCRDIMIGHQIQHTISTVIEQACMHQSQPFKISTSQSMDIEITANILNEVTLETNSVHVTVSDSYGNATQMDIARTSPAKKIFESSDLHILFDQSEAIIMFSFRAVGCEDLMAPEYTWIERKRNVITIGCMHNEYTWQVKCIGSKWIGFRGNCTRQIESKPVEETIDETEERAKPKQPIFTKGIQYALTIGTTVLLCVAVITTGFVCLRKAEYKAKASKGIELQEMTGDYSNTWKATLMRPVTNDLNNPNASPPQQFYVLNQQNDTPIGTLR